MKCKQNEQKNDEKTQSSVMKDAMRKRLVEKMNEIEIIKVAELDIVIKEE